MALALLDIEFERNYNQDLVYGRGRIFRDRSNPLEDLSPELFKYRYRLTKEVVQDYVCYSMMTFKEEATEVRL